MQGKGTNCRGILNTEQKSMGAYWAVSTKRSLYSHLGNQWCCCSLRWVDIGRRYALERIWWVPFKSGGNASIQSSSWQLEAQIWSSEMRSEIWHTDLEIRWYFKPWAWMRSPRKTGARERRRAPWMDPWEQRYLKNKRRKSRWRKRSQNKQKQEGAVIEVQRGEGFAWAKCWWEWAKDQHTTSGSRSVVIRKMKSSELASVQYLFVNCSREIRRWAANVPFVSLPFPQMPLLTLPQKGWRINKVATAPDQQGQTAVPLSTRLGPCVPCVLSVPCVLQPLASLQELPSRMTSSNTKPHLL